jgi:hypothetical protein
MDKEKSTYLIRKVGGRDVKLDADILYHRKIINSTLIVSKGGEVFARNRKTRKTTALARIILKAKKGQIVDHINRDPLDNQRSNLRIVTHRQNMLNRILKNSTGFIGVHKVHKRKHKRIKTVYCAVYISEKRPLRHGSTPSTSLRTGALTTGAQGRGHYFNSSFTRNGLILAAMARDKFIIENKDEEYAPLNFPIFKKEPFKTFLLKSDLCQMRDKRIEDLKFKI